MQIRKLVDRIFVANKRSRLNLLNGCKDEIKGGNKVMWYKFNQSSLLNDGKCLYNFDCFLEPTYCIDPETDRPTYKEWKSDKYVIRKFDAISCVSSNILDGIRFDKNTIHPGKDPRNNYLCLGMFGNQLISPKLIHDIVLYCIIKYNAYDCYYFPDPMDVSLQVTLH